MKTLLVLGALALSATALSAEKNYQYKDLTADEARPDSGKRREPAAFEKRPSKRPAKTIEEKIQDAKKQK